MTAKYLRPGSTAILGDHPTPDRRFKRALREEPTKAGVIIAAPAYHNRATRRSVGLWGSIWRWDQNATEETRRTYIPRYIRRNYRFALVPPPGTDTRLSRRTRKREARIMRFTREKGLL